MSSDNGTQSDHDNSNGYDEGNMMMDDVFGEEDPEPVSYDIYMSVYCKFFNNSSNVRHLSRNSTLFVDQAVYSVAYYDKMTDVIYVATFNSIEAVNGLKFRLQPTQIICNLTTDSHFIVKALRATKSQWNGQFQTKIARTSQYQVNIKPDTDDTEGEEGSDDEYDEYDDDYEDEDSDYMSDNSSNNYSNYNNNNNGHRRKGKYARKNGQIREKEQEWKVIRLQRKHYTLDTCKKTLKALSIKSIETNWDDLDSHCRLSHIKSLLNINDSSLVCSIGGLLDYLGRYGVKSDNLVIESIQFIPNIVNNRKTLEIDSTTMHALSIFVNNKNPSAKGVRYSKQGFSIFGLFCAEIHTKQGKNLLKQWFMYPLTDKNKIEQRLNQIDYLLHIDNDDFYGQIRDCLGEIKGDFLTIVTKIVTCISRPNDWKYLRDILQAISNLNRVIRQHYRNVNYGISNPNNRVPMLPIFAKVEFVHFLLILFSS